MVTAIECGDAVGKAKGGELGGGCEKILFGIILDKRTDVAIRKAPMSARSPIAAATVPAEMPGLGPAYRLTRQRREVYEVLRTQRDHPTATELFIRVKERIPHISLATVYNCLEALTQSGLVKQVNLDRAPSRYCPNLNDHGHFHCEQCGAVADVEFDGPAGAALELPRGTIVSRMEVSIRGLCPKCAKAVRPAKAAKR